MPTTAPDQIAAVRHDIQRLNEMNWRRANEVLAEAADQDGHEWVYELLLAKSDVQLLKIARKYQLAAAMYVAEWFERHEGEGM